MKMIQNILVLDRQKMTEVAFVVMAIISFMPYQARTPHYMLKHSALDSEVINNISNDRCLAMGKDFRFLAMFYAPGIQHSSIVLSRLSVIYKYERQSQVEFSYLSELSSCTLLISRPFNPFTSTPKKVIWHSPITCKNNNFSTSCRCSPLYYYEIMN